MPAIPMLLAQIGLPLLTRILSYALKSVKNPVADAAADALDKLDDPTQEQPLTAEQISAANAALAQATVAEADRDARFLEAINKTAQTEARSEDGFVRRWRPAFGYAVAGTWTLQMTGLTAVIVLTPQHAAEIVTALGGLTAMWAIALSVLGVSVAKRSQDKALAAGHTVPSLLDRMIGRLQPSLPNTMPPNTTHPNLWRHPDTGELVKVR
ncbi:MAG: 3TM-type holin [Pseudomonadota bacterium]